MTQISIGEAFIPQRTLLGPGPSNVSPRVLQAMISPLLGYLDPDFLGLMDDVTNVLQQVFQTSSPLTFAISGTGSAGMEAGLCNLLEPDDTILIGVNGFFGERIAEISRRQGAKVIRVDTEWGLPLNPDEIEQELKRHPEVKALAVVHAETSTGVLQPLEDLSSLAKRYDTLFLVDAVTSLGGSPIPVETLGIDFCYSATQKCIGAPPGLSPVTASERARETMANRKDSPRSWYLDLSLLLDYWSSSRRYHHTAPISMIYALREALRMILEEGLEARHRRHRRNAHALREGLQALDMELAVPEGYRTDQLTSVYIPEGTPDLEVRRTLLYEYGIEIGGGLGKFAGKVWRIGLMGESSKEAYVLALLSALESVLPRHGYSVVPGQGTAAASKALSGEH